MSGRRRKEQDIRRGGFCPAHGTTSEMKLSSVAAPCYNPTDPSFFAFGDVHRLFRTILTRAIIRIGNNAERNRRQIQSGNWTDRRDRNKNERRPSEIRERKNGWRGPFVLPPTISRYQARRNAVSWWQIIRKQPSRTPISSLFPWLDCFFCNMPRFDAHDVEKYYTN